MYFSRVCSNVLWAKTYIVVSSMRQPFSMVELHYASYSRSDVDTITIP